MGKRCLPQVCDYLLFPVTTNCSKPPVFGACMIQSHDILTGLGTHVQRSPASWHVIETSNLVNYIIVTRHRVGDCNYDTTVRRWKCFRKVCRTLHARAGALTHLGPLRRHLSLFRLWREALCHSGLCFEISVLVSRLLGERYEPWVSVRTNLWGATIFATPLYHSIARV